jgi:hypothetical protein
VSKRDRWQVQAVLLYHSILMLIKPYAVPFIRSIIIIKYIFAENKIAIQTYLPFMDPQTNNDPLYGRTLESIVKFLEEKYGWEELGKRIKINCFTSNPSLQSSLKFLRKTPWARKKVEDLFIVTLKKEKV